MRFSISALFFLIASFIFFVFWAVGSKLISEFDSALSPTAPAGATDIINLLPTAFGVIAAVFFVSGILVIFVLDSLADEPEMYWRR